MNPDPESPADETIAFLCDPELEPHLPKPERAAKFVPDWFRALDREMGMADAHGLPGLTVKACLPVTDAFSLGWIIPLPVDVRVVAGERPEEFGAGWAPDAPFRPLDQHHPGQIGAPAPPFESVVPLKWLNPWRIKAPEGCSILFTHPLNHFELPFQLFTGLVDCDRFDAVVNFPFAWTRRPCDVTLKAGTPIAQAIPIPRAALPQRIEARASTPAEAAEQAAATERKYAEESVYRREWRSRER